MGRAVHRRPAGRAADPRDRVGGCFGARLRGEHDRLPAPQGHCGRAGTAGARRHRLARTCGRVLHAAGDHAAHEPRAAEAPPRRRACAMRRMPSSRTARSTRSRTRSKCAMRPSAAGASTSRTSASSCGGCAATQSARARPATNRPTSRVHATLACTGRSTRPASIRRCSTTPAPRRRSPTSPRKRTCPARCAGWR